MTTTIYVAPQSLLWSAGPFVKSPMTVMFRELMIFPSERPRTIVLVRQQLRPWSVTGDRLMAIRQDYITEYENIEVGVMNPDDSNTHMLVRKFADRAQSYLREVAVVAARFYTENEMIGIHADPELAKAADAHALKQAPELVDIYVQDNG